MIGADFLAGASAALVLGDNLLHGHDSVPQLHNSNGGSHGAIVFAYPVRYPERYGVVEFDGAGRVLSLEEKPAKPRSRYAVTGLYVYDHTVVERARQIQPSPRGELEITDLNRAYLADGLLQVELMGAVWPGWIRALAIRCMRRAAISAPWSTARAAADHAGCVRR